MLAGEKLTTFIDRKGRLITVTSLAQSDFEDLLAYANKLIAEDTFVLLSGKPLTREYEETYIQEAIKQMKEDNKIHLVARCGDEFVGSFEVRRYSLRKSHVGEVGISLAPAFRDGGIGKRCMQILIDESKKLGLRLLVLTCFAKNTRAVHVYESVGFKASGVIPSMFLYKGSYEDELRMYLPLV